MSYLEWASHIFHSQKIQDKLVEPEPLIGSYNKQIINEGLNLSPGRDQKITPVKGNIKFPSYKNFHNPMEKAKALHSFANHELMAIEIMCYSLLVVKDQDERFIADLVETIQDEQKHFTLYRNQINELGFEFGDFPVNDFFFSYFQNLNFQNQYYGRMSLTFEAANLDFSYFFSKVFEDLEDLETAKILKEVLKDEIKHVHFGQDHFSKTSNFIPSYLNSLPENLTPERSKGIKFFEHLRKSAGFDEKFITFIKDYKSDFKVTQRKSWK